PALTCGNGRCDKNESPGLCSAGDCDGPSMAHCGNGICETGAPYFESWDTCQDCPQPTDPQCCGKFGADFQPNIQDPVCMPFNFVGAIQGWSNPDAVFACEAGCNNDGTCSPYLGESCSTCSADCLDTCGQNDCAIGLNNTGTVINTGFNFSSPFDGSW